MLPDAPQDPYVRSSQKTPEQAQQDARAKVFGGEPAEDVVKFLQMQGVADDDAREMVDAMFAKREKVIRARGVRKICIGVAMMLVPVIAYFVVASAGYVDLRLLAVCVVVGLGGARFCLKGTFLVVSPYTEKGEVSEQ